MNRRYLPLLMAATFALPQAAAAQDHPAPRPRMIVIGEGEASVAPDMAILTLTVMREAETARQALDDNNAAMGAVIAAMREAGVEDRDLQTAGLRISPRYVYPQNGDGEEQPRIVAYQVSNTLSARVRDIDKAGELIDRSVTLGVNQGGDIVFTSDDPSAVLTQARIRAVEDAMARARTLAEAAGVELGPVVELSEQSFAHRPVPQSARLARMDAATASAAPVEAGENTYRVQVNVTFELKQP